MSYAALLERRRRTVAATDIHIDDSMLHESLKPFQREIVKWAVKGRRRAIWADTGLGKTRMQIEWCRLSAQTSLIVAPLAVCAQTVREAANIGVTCRYAKHGSDVTGPGLWITNYERVDGFDPATFGAVCLDESSILKASDGKTRTKLITMFRDVPARLACTATPGPNDPEELTNHAEFLGHMTRANMLAAYFVHDQDGWRLKGHAIQPMVAWMNSWAIAVRYPSDLGDSDDGYHLPPPRIMPQIVHAEVSAPEGELFAATVGGVAGRSRVRRETLPARVQRAAELIASEPDEPWVIWCGLNDEADEIAARIEGAVNVHGSMSADEKAQRLLDFADGKIRVLVTKPSMAAFGLNWQHCARMIFLGMNDSYEAFYQCIRRCHRFGQRREVHVHIVISALEQEIALNVAEKERRANRLIQSMIDQRKNHD